MRHIYILKIITYYDKILLFGYIYIYKETKRLYVNLWVININLTNN